MVVSGVELHTVLREGRAEAVADPKIGYDS